jgi:hypothetical protein
VIIRVVVSNRRGEWSEIDVDVPVDHTQAGRIVNGMGRQLDEGRHYVHALVTDRGVPVQGVRVTMQISAGSFSSKAGPVTTRSLNTQADGTTEPIVWTFDPAADLPAHVTFTADTGETATYALESCMLDIEYEDNGDGTYDVWVTSDGECPSGHVTLSIAGGVFSAAGNAILLVLMLNSSGVTGRQQVTLDDPNVGAWLTAVMGSVTYSEAINVGGGGEPDIPPVPPTVSDLVTAGGAET